MSMLRHARAVGRPELVRLVVSARSPEDLCYADELTGAEVTTVFTRSVPPGSARAAGRVALADVAPLLVPEVTVYVCGSARFAEAASRLVVDAGVPAERVRVERFGPSG
jgi:ferredoxin-NADP reductase